MARTLTAGGGISLTDNGTAVTVDASSRRESLTANRTYYVRSDGSDSNTGLVNSAGGAFLTLQKAISTVRDGIDLNGFDVTVQVADATYTAGVQLAAPWVGNGTVTLVGNTTTPANCVISTTSVGCVELSNNARLTVRGFKLQTTTSGACLQAYTGGVLLADSVNFGSCAASHVECGQSAFVGLTPAYTISGGGVSHLHCGSPGMISIGAGTVTLSGTPAFSSYFAGAAECGVIVSSATYSGAATGTRFVCHKNAFIEQVGGSLTTMPGNADGITNTGGVYAGTDVPWYMQPFNGGNTVLALRSRHFNNQTFTDRFKVTSETFGGKGYCYLEGDDSYLAGKTHMAGDANVDVTTGTADGITWQSKASVASNFHLFMASANQAAVGYLRRRSSNGDILGFYRDTTSVGSISVTTTNTAYNTSSDYRLKDAAAPLTGSGAFIDALQPKVWTWKQDGSRGVGFIAHELQAVSPSSVTGEKDGEQMQSVAYGSPELIANLVAEVQDLRRRLAALER